MSKQTPNRGAARTRSARTAGTNRRALVAGAAAALAAVVVATGVWAATHSGNQVTGEPLHAATRLGTVELRVSDLDAQQMFYGDVLGLEVLSRANDTVVLGAAGEDLIRLVGSDDPRPAPNEAGLYHSAILYPDASSLATVLEQVAELAPESYQGASDHTVSRAFYLSDPEGNGVELYVDRPRTSWQWDDDRVRMGSAPLDPIAFIAENQSDRPAAAPSVGHVHLKVGDLDDARRFYVDTVGFEITSESDGALFMAAGGYHHHLAANTWASNGAGARASTTGLGSFQLLLPSPAEVQALAERLTTAGREHERTDSGLTVADPWGNRLVVIVDPAAAEAGSPTVKPAGR